MAYLDVLPLADVKTYLKIDDTQNETDAEISSMIKSALRYIESHTNIILYARNISYVLRDGEVNVYEHPINSVVTPASADDYTSTARSFYNSYFVSSDDTSLVLNVGYTLPADVPTDLIDVAKVLVKLMFYEQETEQSFRELIPSWALDILNYNRRFTL